MYRASLLLLSLLGFGAMVALWVTGSQDAYFGILKALGIPVSFRPYIPFLDTHAVVSALECHARGIDVFAENPCDVLGRPHNYSPLWLAASGFGLTTDDDGWLGSILVVSYLGTVAYLLNPRNGRELIVCLLAVFSNCSVLAMERGNADLLLFILVVMACSAFPLGALQRAITYGVIFFCALLKFYPLAAFGLALTEKTRKFLTIALVATLGWLVFLYLSWGDLVRMLPNVPHAEPLADAFSGRNFFVAFGHLVRRAVPQEAALIGGVVGAMYLVAIATALTTALFLIPRSNAIVLDDCAPSRRAVTLFIAGGFIIAGAFFAGQNAAYRGVWLLTLIPLLLQARRASSDTRQHHVAGLALGGILLVMWFEFFHVLIGKVTGSGALQDLSAFLVREPVWWVLVTWILFQLSQLLSSAPFIADMRGLFSVARFGYRARSAN